MLDRVAVFLIMLFVLIGTAAYDRYLVGQGKVGPFEHMLDYAGLGKYGKSEPQSQRTIKREVFNRRFDNLQEALQKIEEQRAALLEHRQEILAELAKANGQMKQEAQNYIKIIDQERDQFMKENPEFKGAVGTIVDANAKATIQDATLDKNKMRQYQNSIVAQQQAADKWQTIMNALGREDQIFADNNKSIDQQWQSGTDDTVNKVKALVEKLDTVSEEDWRQLMKLYEDLWQQQAMLMEGSALTAQRLNDAYAAALRQAKIVESKIDRTKNEELAALVANMKALETQMKSLTKSVMADNQEGSKIFTAIWSTNNQFFNNALVLEKSKVPVSTVVAQQGSSPSFLRQSRPVMDSPQTKIPHQPSIDEQLRPLREKAKQNGYYDHSTPRK